MAVRNLGPRLVTLTKWKGNTTRSHRSTIVSPAVSSNMPNKKKKNQAKNPFYFFMLSLRPQLERQGVVLENGLQTLAEIAGPRWKELPEHEKEVYQEMATQGKANRQHQPRYDRMDCTGEFIKNRVDTVSLNEQRRKQEREEVRRGWPSGKAVCDERFYMVGFMSYYELSDDGYLPCELGAVEYSLNGGILRKLHFFIQPGDIKLGLRFAAMSTSERTHKIPVEGLAKKEDTHRKIWLDLLRFVNPEQTAIFPPVYCRMSETKQTEFCLQWLAKRAELPNKLKKVYELEGLVCDLHSRGVSGSGGVGISKGKATELLSSTIFDYEPNSRCEWHEKQEVKFCALGTVQRYCYCMSDFLCKVYRFPLTPNHLPERPEGTFCTIIKAPEDKLSQEVTRPWGASGTIEDNGPFASRDYRYYNSGNLNEGASYSATRGVYTRSGPTYDQQSLQNTAEDEDVDYNRQQQSTPWQAPQKVSQQQNLGSSFGLGRGRGRGRGMPLNQPLRRPNLNTASGTVANQAASWSVIAASQEPCSSLDNVPSWARTEQPPTYPAGRGTLRAPATKPKVYAGVTSPPAPVHAPMSPAAWQEQMTLPEWQGGRVLPSQMNSLSLHG